jgi:hypothetical protein
MSDARKLIEAKKAAKLAEAAELDRELQEFDRLEAFAKKHNLTLQPASSAPAPTPSVPDVKTIVHGAARGNPDSATARSRAEAEKLIRARGRPVEVKHILAQVLAKGIKVGGKTPAWTLSNFLSADPKFMSTRSGWWLRALPLPAGVIPIKKNGAGAAEGAAAH